jgi:transposase
VVNLKGLMMILELHEQGLSVSAIAERTGHDRKTVRKAIKAGLVVPNYALRSPRPTLLGPYRAYLHERVSAWPELSGARLLREVRERGYGGGITQLNDFLRTVRPPPVAPFEILYDRMKTAVLGEREDDAPIVYNPKLVALGAHYGFTPRACQPYRAQTKGKVERPYRYIRADFFLARRFANLEDMTGSCANGSIR